MKNLLPILLLIIFNLSLFAQDKKIEKIESLYQRDEFEKCISKSDAYIQKNTNQAAPYFYIAMSKMKLFDYQSDINSVRIISKNIYNGMKKENSAEYEKRFENELKSFNEVLKTYAFNYYEANKTQAKFYYDYLAKIYQDTLPQYNEIVLNEEPRPDAVIIELTNKGEINQTDKNGFKQGPWKKVYTNGLTAYEVFFKNDKPVGEYKRYHENGKLSSVLNYAEKSENAYAIFYDENEKKISEGNYLGKLKIGKWIYFQNDIKVKEEDYNLGKLHGFQIIYFDNGQIYDKKKFENDIQVGVWEKYYKNGKPNLKSFLVNGKMDGPVLRYYNSGLIEVKGQYKNDLKEGTWTFYSEDGQTDKIEYKNGIDINEEQVNKVESDEYKNNIEKAKNLLDPSNFKNNPEDYPINQ